MTSNLCVCDKPEPALMAHGMASLCEKCYRPISEPTTSETPNPGVIRYHHSLSQCDMVESPDGIYVLYEALINENKARRDIAKELARVTDAYFKLLGERQQVETTREPDAPDASPLIAKIEAWTKSEAGKRFVCVRDGYYRTPEAGCVGCLLKSAGSALKDLQQFHDWALPQITNPPLPAETAAPPLEKPLAYNVLDEIRERHARVKYLLSITPGTVLGPMDADAAHTDRNYLLGLVPESWTYRRAVKSTGEVTP